MQRIELHCNTLQRTAIDVHAHCLSFARTSVSFCVLCYCLSSSSSLSFSPPFISCSRILSLTRTHANTETLRHTNAFFFIHLVCLALPLQTNVYTPLCVQPTMSTHHQQDNELLARALSLSPSRSLSLCCSLFHALSFSLDLSHIHTHGKYVHLACFYNYFAFSRAAPSNMV